MLDSDRIDETSAFGVKTCEERFRGDDLEVKGIDLPSHEKG